MTKTVTDANLAHLISEYSHTSGSYLDQVYLALCELRDRRQQSEPEVPLAVFALHTGDYEQRGLHSLHSSRQRAEEIHLRVTKDWKPPVTQSDIEEHALDPILCLTCGYHEELHGHLSHAFVPDQSPKPRVTQQIEAFLIKHDMHERGCAVNGEVSFPCDCIRSVQNREVKS